MGTECDQSLDFELPQRLAYRYAADAQLSRDAVLTKRITFRVCPGKDALADRLQRRAGQGESFDGRTRRGPRRKCPHDAIGADPGAG